MRTKTETLIAAMRILSHDIESNDGIANATIAEAADRIEELFSELIFQKRLAENTLKLERSVQESTLLETFRFQKNACFQHSLN